MLRILVGAALKRCGTRAGAAAAEEEGEAPCSSRGSSSSSSPRGAKGGGTLKTCAVCIEDYECAPGPSLRLHALPHCRTSRLLCCACCCCCGCC